MTRKNIPYYRKLTNHEINALMHHNINAVCDKFAFWTHKISAVLQKVHCECMKLTQIGEVE